MSNNDNNLNNSTNEIKQNLNNNENTNQDNLPANNKKVYSKSKDNKILLITVAVVCGIFAIPLVIGAFIHSSFDFYNNHSKNDYNYEDDYYNDEEEEPTDTSTKINIYKHNEKGYLYMHNEDKPDFQDKESTLKYTYTCKNNDCKSHMMYEDLGYALIYDGKYILYDYKKDKTKAITLKDSTIVPSSNLDGLQLLYCDKKIYGYAIQENKEDGKYAIYNSSLGKLVTDYKYIPNDFKSNHRELLDGNLIVSSEFSSDYVNNDYKDNIINFNTGAELLSYDNNDVPLLIYTMGYKNYVYYLKAEKQGPFGDGLNEICDKNLKPIIAGKYREYTVSEEGNIVVKSADTNFSVYTKEGTLVKKSKDYKRIVSLDRNYASIIDNDNYLKILDLNEKEVAKFIEVTNNYEVHDARSGWYETNGKEGVYIVVEDKNVAEGTKGRGIEYYYEPKTNSTGKIEVTYIEGYAKPILYLYPKKNNTKVTVTFDNPELLSTTYPKYKGKWEVTADKNGNLKDANNKEYYALYWDEKSYKKQSFETGFYVTKDNAIEFLEEKLTKIGLNNRERNEFIMYWLPILEKNEKSLVYFELTESRQQFNKINITPEPDSLLRVAIHIKKVDQKVDIKEQKLPKFKRKGFSAVEWGGINY